MVHFISLKSIQKIASLFPIVPMDACSHLTVIHGGWHVGGWYTGGIMAVALKARIERRQLQSA